MMHQFASLVLPDVHAHSFKQQGISSDGKGMGTWREAKLRVEKGQWDRRRGWRIFALRKRGIPKITLRKFAFCSPG